MAYEDEIAAANRLTTREARLAARNAVRAKYGMGAEEKKRGGLAGFYDRNKQFIQAGLPTLAGMLVPGAGAVAGAITGGLARGLDRPGQGGVALNLGQAARGAATGATLGSLGAKFSPVKPSLPAAPAPMPTSTTTPAPTGAGGGGGMPLNVLRDRQETQAIADFARTQPAAMATPASTSPTVVPTAPATSRITDVPGLRLEDIANANVVETPRSIGSRAMSALLQPNVLAPVAGGVADVIGSYQDRLAKQEEIRLKEEQMKREQEAQARLAQLLMPMFQQTVRQYSRPQ